MTVASLASILSTHLSTALNTVVPDVREQPQVRRSEHADFQYDGVLQLARTVGRPPRALAGAVVDALAGTAPGVAVHVAGPGFVNLTVSDRLLWQQAAGRLADPRLGVPSPEDSTVTVIDYSQPNIAKEMHVGHLRSTIIGDALVRVLEHLGGTVVRQNHIGDWGTQFGMLIQYQLEHPNPIRTDGGEPSMSRLGGLYRASRALFDTDPQFAERARRRVVALQAGDPDTVAAWRDIVAESTRYFTDVYDQLDIRLTPADVVGESNYNAALPAVADDLAVSGVGVSSEGALCVFFDDITGPDGTPVPLIVRKSDGGYGYAATDLAALRHRITSLRADRILYVVDARQALHFRMVFATARRAGWLPDTVQAVHVPFGTVLGTDGRPFKARAGETVRLIDLITEAVDGARQVIAAKNPTLTGDGLEQRARQVGVGALKYADLANHRTRDYTHDPARMLALTGNTSVYLQYAHARIRSILTKAGSPDDGINPGVPVEPAERALLLHLDAFADTLTDVAVTFEPHRLCGYLHGLAQRFTTFYEHCPVLKAAPQVRDNRLALCRLAGDTLQTGLDLLGIAAPPHL